MLAQGDRGRQWDDEYYAQVHKDEVQSRQLEGESERSCRSIAWIQEEGKSIQTEDSAAWSDIRARLKYRWLGKKLPSIRNTQIVEHRQAEQTRIICVLIALQASVSFRSVPRILQVLAKGGCYPTTWVPHFTSVINWVLRVGLSCLQSVTSLSEPWIAIIDHSIDIGIKKVLVILRVPVSRLKEKDQAIDLSDCECIGVHVSEKTDHETVAQQLLTTFGCAGTPTAIIKDQAPNLSKGVSQWRKIAGVKKVTVVDDIGHVLANALKAEFGKTRIFVAFLDRVRKGSARLRQTSWAFVLPPKIRTKGRFQSISKLSQWAEKILSIMQQPGRARENSHLEALRKAFPDFCQFKTFIERFAKATRVANKISMILKNKGLNQQTYRECQQLALELPPRSKVRMRALRWLRSHLAKHCHLSMKQLPLLVSSDIIESLFGRFKHIIERSPISDINRMALAIPALCGNIDQALVVKALKETRHADISKWETENISHTLRKKRQVLFKEDCKNE